MRKFSGRSLIWQLRTGLLLSLVVCIGFLGEGQAQNSDLLKRKWYHNVVRVIKGGDGHFYLIRNQSGQYWNFGRSGIHRFEVWRFGPNLHKKGMVQIANGRNPDFITNAFEVLPSPDGIAFLSVGKGEEKGLHELQVCSLEFTGDSPSFSCNRLAALHEFSMKISQPDIRIAYSPDRNYSLITWRLISGRETSDKATACLVLDKELKVVKGPFSPLLGARRDCQLLRIGLADADHLLFWVRSYTTGNVLVGAQSASFHLLEYDGIREEVREIRLDNQGNMMMDARLQFGDDGSVSVAGWWINGKDPGRNAGVYFGQIGE